MSKVKSRYKIRSNIMDGTLYDNKMIETGEKFQFLHSQVLQNTGYVGICLY